MKYDFNFWHHTPAHATFSVVILPREMSKGAAAIFFALLVSTTVAALQRDAGILYEIWHAPAAYLARRVRFSKFDQF